MKDTSNFIEDLSIKITAQFCIEFKSGLCYVYNTCKQITLNRSVQTWISINYWQFIFSLWGLQIIFVARSRHLLGCDGWYEAVTACLGLDNRLLDQTLYRQEQVQVLQVNTKVIEWSILVLTGKEQKYLVVCSHCYKIQ